MRILYGIAGDGLGHAVRSTVVIKELIRQGHDVRIVLSGDACSYIKQKFSSVTEIWGLSVVTNENKVSEARTLLSNIHQGLSLSGLPRNMYKVYEVAREFEPDVVISDHELWSWFFGKLHQTPVIGLDNVHALSRCEHPPGVIEGLTSKYPLARLVVEARVPKADHYLVSMFERPRAKKRNTTVVPPVLRQEILDAEPTGGEHLLAYQTSYASCDLTSVYKEMDRPVIIYGEDDEREHGETEENLTFRHFDETQFIRDLASCRAVIGSAGFTLITESLHLGKPYFAVPVDGQVEQMLNARYLDWHGYGDYSLAPRAREIRSFLNRVPSFQANLRGYERHDNQRTFDNIHRLLRRYREDKALRPAVPKVTHQPEKAAAE